MTAKKIIYYLDELEKKMDITIIFAVGLDDAEIKFVYVRKQLGAYINILDENLDVYHHVLDQEKVKLTYEKSIGAGYKKSNVLGHEKSNVLISEKSNVLTYEKSNVLTYEKSNVLTYEKSNVLDSEKVSVLTFSGWDIKKYLSSMYDNCGITIEWLQSKKKYIWRDEIMCDILPLVKLVSKFEVMMQYKKSCHWAGMQAGLSKQQQHKTQIQSALCVKYIMMFNDINIPIGIFDLMDSFDAGVRADLMAMVRKFNSGIDLSDDQVNQWIADTVDGATDIVKKENWDANLRREIFDKVLVKIISNQLSF